MHMSETAATAFLDQTFAAITAALEVGDIQAALDVADTVAEVNAEAGTIVGDGVRHAFFAGGDY